MWKVFILEWTPSLRTCCTSPFNANFQNVLEFIWEAVREWKNNIFYIFRCPKRVQSNSNQIPSLLTQCSSAWTAALLGPCIGEFFYIEFDSWVIFTVSVTADWGPCSTYVTFSARWVLTFGIISYFQAYQLFTFFPTICCNANLVSELNESGI